MAEKLYSPSNIRNVVLLSHGGVGKTTLAEAMLFTAGVTTRLGRVEEGNTVSDFQDIEITRKSSVNLSLVHLEHNEVKINVLDVPGYADFVGDLISGCSVADSVIVLISSQAGVEVGTQQAWAYREGKPVIFFVSRLDRENADFHKSLTSITENFGNNAVPFILPIGVGENFTGVVDILSKTAYKYEKSGKGIGTKIEIPPDLNEEVEQLHHSLIERAAESDEKLMEKYFEKGELSPEEIIRGLSTSVHKGELFPIFFGSAFHNIGVDLLMDAIVKFLPSPADIPPIKGSATPDGELTLERKCSVDEPFSGFAFKLLTEPHIGDLTFMRVYSGKVKAGDDVINSLKGESERIGQVFAINGKSRIEIPELSAGDIGVTVKLKNTRAGHTLCDKKAQIIFPRIRFPKPVVAEAVKTKNKGDEDKIAQGLSRIHDEDPTFFFEVDPELKQTLIYGQGEVHLELVLQKIRERFGVEVELKKPRIPYRETITTQATSRYRHKKQTGGAGQFAEIEMRIEPLPRGTGFEYEWDVFGGAISSGFQGSIEKGIKQILSEGVIAGYPIVDIKAIVVDGKEHPVDSKDIAFTLCAREVFRQAFEKASPILLEPIMKIEVVIPEEFTGDIMGDISSRRGKIQGMEPVGKNLQKVLAIVPQAELYKYSSSLRSMTQGRGWFSQEFDHYEPVPKEFAQRIIEESQKLKEEEK